MGDDTQSAADGREQPAPPPTELETVYTTPVPGIRITTSDVSRNSMDMPGRLALPREPLKIPHRAGSAGEVGGSRGGFAAPGRDGLCTCLQLLRLLLRVSAPTTAPFGS